MQRLQFGTALCGIVLLVSGCGAGGHQPGSSLASHVPFPENRAPAALAVFIKQGNEDSQRSSNATEFGTALQLDAVGADIEYAVYILSPGNTPNQLDVNIDELNTTEFWVGVANYTSLTWVMDGPFTTVQSFAMAATNLSPLGNVPVAIVTPPGQTVRIDNVQVSANNDPPAADLQASAGGPAPVQITFDASGSQDPDGSIELYEWDWENDGTYDASGVFDSIQHVYLLEGNYTCKVRVTDNGGLTGTATAGVSVTAALNDPPNAVLTGPADGAPPFMANFDASGSNDPDGTITNYSWDLDGDGLFNTTGAEIAVEGLNAASVNITEPGSYAVAVEVTDDVGGPGGVDTASDTVVASGWKFFTLSINGEETGRINYLALINGKPAIIFHVYDSAQIPARSVRYAYSTTDTGSNLADWAVVTTPLTISGGQQMTLAEVAGHPAIAYGGGNSKLAYSRSATVSGASPADWVAVIADNTANSSGTYNSLALINGNPAIAYQGPDENTCYVRSSTTTGMDAADWSTPVVIDGALWSSGSFVSLAQIGGNPAIAYGDQETGGNIKYARANNASGTPDTAWSGVGSSKFVLASNCSFPSLRDVNGFPGMAYLDYTSLDLSFATSSTASGGDFADWTLLSIDGGADDTGVLPSLALIHGNPAVSHQVQGAEFDLEYTRATDANGHQLADWPGESIKVDEPGDVGGYCSLAEINGFAAISYYDNSFFNLKYAILFE